MANDTPKPATIMHWTDAQQWRELQTHAIATAAELIARYGQFLREHRIMLIDAPRGQGVRMPDNSVWYRWTDK